MRVPMGTPLQTGMRFSAAVDGGSGSIPLLKIMPPEEYPVSGGMRGF